jgi:predicted permease
MQALIAVQATFCFLVLFVAALFVSTFERLSNQPVGFSSERLLTLDTVAHPARPAVFWGQMEDRLRAIPGVEKVGLARWPLLTGTASNGFISTGDVPNDVLAFFLQVSAEWRDTMKIPLLAGRDFRADETGVAIVNETFARQYFEGGNPVGKFFARTGGRERFEIVGLTRDARYRNIRETTLPVAYVPFPVTGADGLPQTLARASFLVRTSGSGALRLAPALRREVQRAGFGFRVANLRTQREIDQAQTVRERLLALLALFFAMVALVLAGIGLYGVLDYSVLQRRREIGIRMAIGAGAAGIARLVTWEVFSMVLAGALAGLALGMLTARYLESLLYQVKSTDPGMLALPGLAIVAAALLAALPAVIRAVRIDPAVTLRAE